MRFFNLPSRHFNRYLEPGHLADVLALIQVLAFDEHVHRSEGSNKGKDRRGLQYELEGEPTSASSSTWKEIAKSHPEFFRVDSKPGSVHSISLVARHVAPKDDSGVRALPPEFVGLLLETAINLYDRQVKLAERWTYLIPIWVTLVGSLFSLFAILLKAKVGGS